MTAQSKYILSTGSKDYQRLMLLSRLYNPGALAFMQKAGLKPGMKVLEIGCGTGHMAVDLAKKVGEHGRVFATDNSEAQLAIAKQTAKDAGAHNIEFAHLDLNHDLPKYQKQFDFIYGRWVIEWNPKAMDKILSELFQTLNPGGVLVYESIDDNDTGMFSYSDKTIAKKYEHLSKEIFKLGADFSFIKKAYFLLKKFGADHVDMAPNQAILKTPEEKSVLRLGALGVEKLVKDKIMSDREFDKMVADFTTFEQSEDIAGFFRNYLVSGQRSKKMNSISCSD